MCAPEPPVVFLPPEPRCVPADSFSLAPFDGDGDGLLDFEESQDARRGMGKAVSYLGVKPTCAFDPEARGQPLGPPEPPARRSPRRGRPSDIEVSRAAGAADVLEPRRRGPAPERRRVPR